ncbi:hypothetical protein C7M84_015219 [Penaeus vannamei]|uniref:protein-tyrosine-phosphatase n=1 Tax=Penaeus vannamei TaxID=6689 RepID=A0A3R7SM65_PENVA|nr:hypothetical protein C7M84_015219 [Penaeus vannamei]
MTARDQVCGPSRLQEGILALKNTADCPWRTGTGRQLFRFGRECCKRRRGVVRLKLSAGFLSLTLPLSSLPQTNKQPVTHPSLSSLPQTITTSHSPFLFRLFHKQINNQSSPSSFVSSTNNKQPVTHPSSSSLHKTNKQPVTHPSSFLFHKQINNQSLTLLFHLFHKQINNQSLTFLFHLFHKINNHHSPFLFRLFHKQKQPVTHLPLSSLPQTNKQPVTHPSSFVSSTKINNQSLTLPLSSLPQQINNQSLTLPLSSLPQTNKQPVTHPSSFVSSTKINNQSLTFLFHLFHKQINKSLTLPLSSLPQTNKQPVTPFLFRLFHKPINNQNKQPVTHPSSFVSSTNNINNQSLTLPLSSLPQRNLTLLFVSSTNQYNQSLTLPLSSLPQKINNQSLNSFLFRLFPQRNKQPVTHPFSFVFFHKPINNSHSPFLFSSLPQRNKQPTHPQTQSLTLPLSNKQPVTHLPLSSLPQKKTTSHSPFLFSSLHKEINNQSLTLPLSSLPQRNKQPVTHPSSFVSSTNNKQQSLTFLFLTHPSSFISSTDQSLTSSFSLHKPINNQVLHLFHKPINNQSLSPSSFLFVLFPQSESREVVQFHYTEWPSHTQPFINALLEFRRRIRLWMKANILPADGPTIVHCSDGGARTGVFMSIDANLELHEEDGKFDLYGYLKKMRQARRGLIETVDQYRFVFDALEEFLLCGYSFFPVSELSQRLKHKSMKVLGNKSEYQVEFEQICKMTPRFTIGDCAGGHRADNRVKNRNVLCVPPDNSRPYITSFQGNSNTDYINAVFVDGYTHPREYIVTEWPTTQTLGDLWSLVFDHDCSAVVVLCDPTNAVNYPPFWPEKQKSMKYGPVFTIDHISHQHYQNIRSWVFKISKKIVSLTELMAGIKAEPKTCHLFQLMCWPQGHKVPTSTNALVELMNMVERWRQRTGYGPVVVVSPDGMSRAGVYCAANACIEQVIQHGEVDVFQAVKTVRRHRPQLINNMTEYKYCYDLVLHYVLHFLSKENEE